MICKDDTTPRAQEIFLVTSLDDMLALRESAAEGHDEVHFPGGMNPTYWAHRWWEMIDAGEAFALSTERGAAIGGLLFRDIHNGDPTCVEGFWFAPKSGRDGIGLRLLKEWERVAQGLGAVRIGLGRHAGVQDERMDRLYRRRGYAPTECIYMKDV